MEYVAVSFRSRAHTVKFYGFLRDHGVYSEIINTPKEAGVGCGLSVKISVNDLPLVRRAVKVAGLGGFAGFFHVKMLYGKRTVRSI